MGGANAGGSCLAVLTAAGSGARLGADIPKALVLLDGEPLVGHAARALARAGCIDELIIMCPAGWLTRFAEHFPEARVPGEGLPVELVVGGPTRQSSVALGLAVADERHDVVLVHDAARALASAQLVRRVAAAVRAGHPAVIPGLAVGDTIKQVGPDDGSGAAVVATVDRRALRAVQTPQGFDRALLDRAHRSGAARAGDEAEAASDDAGLVEALGEAVWVVAGEEEARKITVPADLLVARAMLSRS